MNYALGSVAWPNNRRQRPVNCGLRGIGDDGLGQLCAGYEGSGPFEERFPIEPFFKS
jgi:hypothetical protein